MRNDRARYGIAIAVLVLSWVPAAASVIIAWVFALPQDPVEGVFLAPSPLAVQSRFDDIGVVVALIYGPLSAVLIARRPHPVAGILAVHALGSAVAAFGVQWGLLGERIPDLPLWGFLAHAAGWGYIPGTVMTTVIPLLLITGFDGLRRTLVWVAVALATLGFVAAFTQQAEGGPPNPFAIPDAAFQAAAPDLYAFAVTAALAVSAITAVIIVIRWLRQSADERRGLGWLVTGHIFLTLSYAALVVPASDDIPTWFWDFGMIAPVLGQIFYPAAVLVMVLGQRMTGIDVAVNRILLWAILVVIAGGAYLLLVGVMSSIVGWGDEAIGITAAAVVALGLQPLRTVIQRSVDRLVYSSGADPRELVRSLGERVGELESGAEGLTSLAEALRAALRLGSVRILPTWDGAAGTIALRAGDEVVGSILVTPRDGERLTRRAVRTLEELSGIVAAALQLVSASNELESARDEVLAVRQEERRQIRRELHDGIGPALAGIGFGLAGVSNMLETSPVAARELLDRLTGDLRERLVAVRELARSMRPANDLADLAARLEGLAEDFSGAGPFVTVHAPAAASLSPEVREASYFIAAEAVHNAVRHAGASRIDIELVAHDDGVVRLTIADDGSGFDPHAAVGVGTASMRERATGVGASLGITSTPAAGTTVAVDFDARQPASAGSKGGSR
ncbi:hypothetical protein BH10ACT7_BH10ACT7_17570 [soil metagenome]